MRRLVLIIPKWLSQTGEDSLLKQPLPGLARFAESGEILRLEAGSLAMEPREKGGLEVSTPESALLGMDPRRHVLQEGPLLVSALGADPPPGSVHFHLSLLALEEGLVQRIRHRIPEDQLRLILDQAKKLNTRVLTLVEGEETEHGLVWEDGSIELGTAPVTAVEGKPMGPSLPEGDGETMLRRFIDDSVNLLSELPLNYERAEEGLQPANLLWPWGQGFRPSLPNLALRRGGVCHVQSASLRLEGLSRLVGYRHGNRAAFGKLTKVNLATIFQAFRESSSSLAYIDSFVAFRDAQRWEEMSWLSKEIDAKLLTPLWEFGCQEPLQLCLAAPTASSDSVGLAGDQSGLLLRFRTGFSNGNPIPFDERALDEKKLETTVLWQAIDAGLGS